MRHWPWRLSCDLFENQWLQEACERAAAASQADAQVPWGTLYPRAVTAQAKPASEQTLAGPSSCKVQHWLEPNTLSGSRGAGLLQYQQLPVRCVRHREQKSPPVLPLAALQWYVCFYICSRLTGTGVFVYRR